MKNILGFLKVLPDYKGNPRVANPTEMVENDRKSDYFYTVMIGNGQPTGLQRGLRINIYLSP